MPFQASSLAMVQSTETWRTSPAWTQGRGRFRACAARIFCVRVIGRRVCAETIGAATCIVLAPSATGVVNKYAGEGMETWYERLSTLDSLFLELEDRSAHMHVGVSGVDLAHVLMARRPDPSPPPAPAPWKPRKAPKTADLLVSSIKEQLSNPLRMARQALQPNSEAVKLLSELFSGLRPFVDVVTMGRAPLSPLNVPIGPHRRFEMVEIPLAKVKAVR